jgi:hypothetical protein
MKIRIPLGTAMIVCALAFTASSALATFVSTAGKPEGTFKGSKVTFGLGGGVDVCQNPKGHYFIKKSDEEQGLENEGKHETEGVEEQGPTECEFITKGGLKTKGTVSACNLHLISNAEQFKELTGAVEKECVLKSEGCEIKLPTAGNKELLKAADVVNSGTNDIVKAHATGITVSASALCEVVGIKSSKEGKLETEVTNVGQNVR